MMWRPGSLLSAELEAVVLGANLLRRNNLKLGTSIFPRRPSRFLFFEDQRKITVERQQRNRRVYIFF